MKSLNQIAEMTVEFNNSGRTEELLSEIYDAGVESVEAAPMPDGSPATKGLEALKGKWEWWESAHDVHETTATGPFYHGDDRFGVIYEIDVTEKASGQRSQMRELGLYTVANGKIVKEEFFYQS